MINKLHDEWEKLSEEARQTEDSDPRRHAEILDRMRAVTGALQRLSQGAVTRTSLSQAVRAALGVILESDREALFPEIAALRGELSTRLGGIESQIHSGLASLETKNLERFREIAQRVNQRLDAIQTGFQRRLEEAAAGSEGRIEIEARLADLQGRIGLGEERAAALDGKIASLSREVGLSAEALRAIGSDAASGSGRAAELAASIGGKVQEMAAGIARRLEEQESQLEVKLAERLEVLSHRVGAGEERLLDADGRLAALGAEAGLSAEALRAATAALRGELNGSLDAVVADAAALARRAAEQEARLEGVAGSIHSRAEAIEVGLDRVRESLADLEARLGCRVEEAASRAARLASELESRLGEQGTRVAALGQDLASADDQLAEGLKELEGRLSGRMSAVESGALSRAEAVESSLRQSLAAAETRQCESQGRLEAELRGAIESLATRVARELSDRIEWVEATVRGLRDVEERVQKQMRVAMEQLEEKVNSVIELVGQVQAALPPPRAIEGLEERLVRIEAHLRSVSDQMEGVCESLPEIRLIGEQLGGLRGEVSGLTGDLSSAGREQRDAWDLVGRKAQDIQDLLRAGVERWDADRSQARQRLVDLRDTLRDQLRAAVQRAESGGGGLIGKLLHRPEGGARFDVEEWERFRTRLETIVQGLESLLTEN